MRHFSKVAALTLSLCLLPFSASAAVSVFGPGGPAPAMKAAAEAFQKKTGITVTVTAGPTSQWASKAATEADIIYSGSEAMMSDFEKQFAAQIQKESVEPLYLRPAAILVRKGNPKKITGIKDLLKPSVKILVTHGAGQVGMWEDIVGRSGKVETVKAFRKNIATFAPNTGEAKNTWLKDHSLDAWLVFNIWGMSNPDAGDIVAIEPEFLVYRDSGIALTHKGAKNKESQQFIDFLQSDKGFKIFKSFGWTK